MRCHNIIRKEPQLLIEDTTTQSQQEPQVTRSQQMPQAAQPQQAPQPSQLNDTPQSSDENAVTHSSQPSDAKQTPQSQTSLQSSELQHNDTIAAASISHRYSVVQRQHLNDIPFEQMPNGLVPVVTQDEISHAVLMVAYCNREALIQTLQTGYAHYFSRSRNQLWKKGETSGNIQLVQQVLVDCDNDAILYIVRQHGIGACHTGRASCFFSDISTQ